MLGLPVYRCIGNMHAWYTQCISLVSVRVEDMFVVLACVHVPWDRHQTDL